MTPADPRAVYHEATTNRVADQQNKRKCLGERVWLIVDGKRRSGGLWWIGEDGVMIREPSTSHCLRAAPRCSDDGGPTVKNDRNAPVVGGVAAPPPSLRKPFQLR